MMIALTARSSTHVVATLRQYLKCPGDDVALQEALAADHIRSAVYANAVACADSGINPTVHTTRLMASVRKSLDLLWPRVFSAPKTSTDDLTQQMLDKLAQAGDLVDTGGGYWLAAPLRIVRDPQNLSFLVLGAIPNESLRAFVDQELACAATARFLALPPLRSNAQLRPYFQSVDVWLGQDEPLRPWTERFLRSYEARMTSANDSTAEQLEIYAPDLFAARHQKGRWMPASQLVRSLPDIRLCRPLAGFTREWSRPYYLAQFAVIAGAPIVVRSANVPFDATLRLRLGLDEVLGCQRTASIRCQTDTLQLDMPYALPNPEARVMAFGWPSRAASGRTQFHALILPILLSVFRRLAIKTLIYDGG